MSEQLCFLYSAVMLSGHVRLLYMRLLWLRNVRSLMHVGKTVLSDFLLGTRMLGHGAVGIDVC